MSTLDGAFANLHNFLFFVALPNCTEFFRLEQAETEEMEKRGELADPTKRELSRALFNAVVSLDAVLDYAFHAERGGTNQRPFNEMLEQHEPAITELREISNALKHCVTRADAKTNSAEVLHTYVQAQLGVTEVTSSRVTVKIEAELLAKARSALTAAFRFWLSQGQKMDARDPRLAIPPTPGSDA